MHELERIEQALAEKHLDPAVFERCAQDLLIEIYPGLSPIPGGTDFGRDADAHGTEDVIPRRILVTTSRDYSGIRANMLRGVKSMQKNDLSFDGIVLANPGSLSATDRKKLRDEAAALGARVEAVYDRSFFASRLRRDGEWRERLLGLSGEPITISRVPAQLAESPWSQLPLVGRDEVRARLIATSGDVILVGQPGVGKTRLLVSLPDAVFVDPDAGHERLADDLRWLQPQAVVIDDAGRSERLLRFIQRLRREEDDGPSPQIIAVCWPDELEAMKAQSPGATEMRLDLLERADVDAIVRAMGISSVLARQEILDQAEGRPGWAVALGDLLLRSGWAELLTGRALLGQIDGYVRRSRLTQGARDLLAVAAALRGVTEEDLANVASILGTGRADTGRLVRAIAQGGLLDVSQLRTADGVVRRYTVRPPILADAVATEHYFLGDAPLGDLQALRDTWPQRHLELALTTCTAAALGAERAKEIALRTIEAVLQSGPSPDDTYRLLRTYCIIDAEAGAAVVSLLANEIQSLEPEQRDDPYSLENLVRLAHLIAGRYLNVDAVQVLLELAVLDERPTNPHLDHPLRKIGDLCTSVHPDIRRNADRRIMVADAISGWLPQEPNASQWRVWASVVAGVLTPHERGSYPSPEDPLSVSIIETVVTPETAAVIIDTLWPQLLEGLRRAPPDVVSEVVSVVHDWLRVGRGVDQPFGHDHPGESIRAADTAGRQMLMDLADIARGHPGLVTRVSGTAALFGIELPEDRAHEVTENPFYRDVDRLDDWRKQLDQIRADIEIVVVPWAAKAPATALTELVAVRDEIEASGLRWPDRVSIACSILAEHIDEPREWVRVCLELGLFPEGAAFLDRVVRDSEREADLIRACLDDPQARSSAILATLRAAVDDEARRDVVESLTAQDYRLLDALVLREEIDIEVQRTILRDAPPEAQGALALAMAAHKADTDASIPDALRTDWETAVLEIDPTRLPHDAQYEISELITRLATKQPELAERFVQRRLQESEAASRFEALGYDVWMSLHSLPAENKTSLFMAFRDDPVWHWLLLEHLTGSDVAWLESLLDRGVITPDEALQAHGMEVSIPLDQLAQLLVPRGVEPARIARLAMIGSWTGPESEQYRVLLEQAQSRAVSDDESVAAVGHAGIALFTQLQREALEQERQARIHGYRR